MSINLYGMIEIYNRKESKWESYSLLTKNDEGLIVKADPFTGGRTAVDIVLGNEPLDWGLCTEEEESYGKNGLLISTIEDIIKSAQYFDIENQCSEEVRERLKNYIGPDKKQYIPIAVYTDFDITVLGVLASMLSERAEWFYEQAFGNAKAVMDVVGVIKNIYCLSDIRVILYGL